MERVGTYRVVDCTETGQVSQGKYNITVASIK